MHDDIIEIRIYDKDYTKHFQFDAKIDDKKAIKKLIELLNQKGILIQIKNEKNKEDTGFF